MSDRDSLSRFLTRHDSRKTEDKKARDSSKRRQEDERHEEHYWNISLSELEESGKAREGPPGIPVVPDRQDSIRVVEGMY